MTKEMHREARYYEGLRFAELDVTLYCLEMLEGITPPTPP